MELPSPFQLKREAPLSATGRKFVDESRQIARNIIDRSDERLAAIVGPCSIHDPKSAVEYAEKLKEFARGIDKSFFPVMRLFIEKSRTRLGWKGMLYDPHLDGSNDIASGLRISRQILLEITELGIPCSMELLEPLAVPYFDDLIVWGVVGARTSASQPHRQMASGLSFPVGFKNDIHGEIDVAVSGIVTSRDSHSHIGIDGEGKISGFKTRGNPHAHLILRGSETQSNFDGASVSRALEELKSHHLEPSLLIDCSHGNSKKDHRRQKIALESIVEQVNQGNKSIAGFMFESHLNMGKQPLQSALRYGVSITDSCLGWEETESLLAWAAERCSMNTMSSINT